MKWNWRISNSWADGLPEVNWSRKRPWKALIFTSIQRFMSPLSESSPSVDISQNLFQGIVDVSVMGFVALPTFMNTATETD
jgi:hypothetical protein